MWGPPPFIDPLDGFNTNAMAMIMQVVEGLFTIDVKSNNSAIIPHLAKNYEWSADGLNLTCQIRKSIKFHDGTPFNATAVKWNFDRIYRLIDWMMYGYLWLLPDGTPIINETQVIDDYTVKFVLNTPYVPLISLLASYSAYIVSPSSTPADEFIDPDTDNLVGTGPFIYDGPPVFHNINESQDCNFTLSVNPRYWGAKPKIDKIVFHGIEDFTDRIEAMYSGKVDILCREILANQTAIEMFRENSSFTVTDGLLPYIAWIVMNNKLINTTMRMAISYASNYSSFIDYFNRYDERIIRAKSSLPESILYYNTTGIDIPYYNLTLARQTLINVGWPGTEGLTANDNISAGNEWAIIALTTPLATYNYTSWCLSSYSIGVILTENLKQIGVKIEMENISIFEFMAMVYEKAGYHRNMFGLLYNYWIADYNDASNFIDLFFTNKMIAENAGQVNDTLIQKWMEDALIETNPTARARLYYQIQKRLIEEIYPHIWLYTITYTTIQVSNLKGWYPNWYRIEFKYVKFT